MESQGAKAGQAEDAYIAGMLHDVGKLMLANSLPDHYREAAIYAVGQQIPLHAAETEVFGATHAGVGAYLLGLWGLPAPIVEAVAFHHTPTLSDMPTFGPLASVHVANVLDAEQSAARQPMPLSGFNDDYLSTLKVQDQLATWRGLSQKINSVPERNVLF